MKLTQEKQISYRSTPGIVADLDFAAARLARKVKFDDGKLRTGHLVNAVALWLGRMPDDDLERLAVPLLRELEVYLGRDDAESEAEGGSVGPVASPDEPAGRAKIGPGKGKAVEVKTDRKRAGKAE